MSGPGALADEVDHFRRRVLQDALNEATAAFWLRRAADFERVGTPVSKSGVKFVVPGTYVTSIAIVFWMMLPEK